MRAFAVALALAAFCTGCVVLDDVEYNYDNAYEQVHGETGPGAAEGEVFVLHRNCYEDDDGWRLGMGICPGYHHHGTRFGSDEDPIIYTVATVTCNLICLYPTLASILMEPLSGFTRRCAIAHSGLIGFHYWRLEPTRTFHHERDQEHVVRCDSLVRCAYFRSLHADVERQGYADRKLPDGRVRRFRESKYDPKNSFRYEDR